MTEKKSTFTSFNPTNTLGSLTKLSSKVALGAVLFSSFIHSTSAETALVGDVNSGAQIYNAVCKGCHGVSIAPTLRGIIDRPIASTSFTGYSDGLKSKQGKNWSVDNLNIFLTAPLEFAPGTLMIQTVPDAQKRADIITFLSKLPPPRK